MSTSDDRVLRTLRAMAWEKAKGELHAMMQTYWGDAELYEGMRNALAEFIKNVEDNGLHE